MKYIFPRYPQGKFKAVTFSYDDGCNQDIRLSQVLSKHGIKATFNINTCRLNGSSPKHLSANAIKENLLDKGFEIAIHGDNHKAPGICFSELTFIKDILDCKEKLEKEYGKIIRGYAYPDGGITLLQNGNDIQAIKDNLKKLDVQYARTLGKDNDKFLLPNDFLEWVPTCHHTNPEALNYAQKFIDFELSSYCSSKSPRLFYLWGHSYEFDHDDNWELLEKLCDILGGKDDIWYATNIEICEYIKAYQNLVFSADQSICFNPTVKTLWFDFDSKLYKIESGETVIIDNI